jgi:hypothetical protein
MASVAKTERADECPTSSPCPRPSDVVITEAEALPQQQEHSFARLSEGLTWEDDNYDGKIPQEELVALFDVDAKIVRDSKFSIAKPLIKNDEDLEMLRRLKAYQP